MDSLILYSYFRSSASYRVRAALNLKKLKYSVKAINLKSGEHLLPDFNSMSTFSELPVFSHNGNQMAQSMAIIDFLENEFPQTYSLFPKTSYDRAIVLQMCEVINSGIHPIQNLKVGKKLKADHGFTPGDVATWNKYWIKCGFENFEKLLEKFCGKYCFGNEVTCADLFLVPQVYNGKRFNVDLGLFPNIERINKNALEIEEIKLAGPHYQDDTPDNLK